MTCQDHDCSTEENCLGKQKKSQVVVFIENLEKPSKETGEDATKPKKSQDARRRGHRSAVLFEGGEERREEVHRREERRRVKEGI
jgi:hypothetical protein